jgi:hypothetical protein
MCYWRIHCDIVPSGILRGRELRKPISKAQDAAKRFHRVIGDVVARVCPDPRLFSQKRSLAYIQGT